MTRITGPVKKAVLIVKANKLVKSNDTKFKYYLDRYKYADRYPEYPAEHYRSQCEIFLRELEEYLTVNKYLLNDRQSAADIGIFPFIRQYAFVDQDWFEKTPYVRLQIWLARLLDSDLFNAVMNKYPTWEPGAKPVIMAR